MSLLIELMDCSKPPTDDDIDVAEGGLRRVRKDLTERRQTITRLEAAQPKADSSWLTKVVPNFRGDNRASILAPSFPVRPQ